MGGGMQRSVWIAALLGVSLSASAAEFESDPEKLEFDDTISLFGNVPSFDIGSSVVYLDVVLEPSTDVQVYMEGEVLAGWPIEEMSGVPAGLMLDARPNQGRIGVDSEFEFGLNLVVDIGIYSNTFELLDNDVLSIGSDFTSFDPYLLPDSSEDTVHVDIEDASALDALDLDYSFSVWGIEITIGVEFVPIGDIDLTGVAVDIVPEDDGATLRFTGDDQIAPLDIREPTAHWDGYGRFEGVFESGMGISIRPVLNANLFGLFDLDLAAIVDAFTDFPFRYDVEDIFATSETHFIETEDFEIGLPILELNQTAIDFGVVQLGAATSVDLELENDGRLYVDVLMEIEGEDEDAFEISEDYVYMEEAEDMIIEVQFIPQGERVHTAILKLETNDPLQPFIEIPLTGRTPDAPDDAPGVTDNNGGGDDVGVVYNSCGCAASPSGFGAAPLLGLLGFIGLRRRRS